jgi:hypothetical protein
MDTGYMEAAAMLGLGATLVMDGWMALRKRLFGIAAPDYALVGRWLGHMRHGRFRHDRIAASSPLRGERALGWIAHYLTGIAFAALLLAIFGTGWLDAPTPGPALAVGIATVTAPFLLMQPGMGAGIAASRTPRPASALAAQILG